MSFVSIVAGGAGFIGTNLVPFLTSRERVVVIADNSRTLHSDVCHQNEPGKSVVRLRADLSCRTQVNDVFAVATSLGNVDEVWHLAANSDIPTGVNESDIDFKDTFKTTYELLRAMRDFKVTTFHFASSSAVYGDMAQKILTESSGPLLPISNYGAMKLASEAQASAAAEVFLDRVNIFRFPNVVGTPATHGVILDFIDKLKKTPDRLEVLGDGTQQKPYLHVSDLIRAMFCVADRKSEENVMLVNIGPSDEGITVRSIAECVVARVSPSAEIRYGSERRGWIGDVPKFRYSTSMIESFGWQPKLTSSEAIARAVNEIATQQGM